MRRAITKILPSRLMRGIRIYALLCVVGSIASVSASDVLITDSLAQACPRPCGAGMICNAGVCEPTTGAPEIPLEMLPVFLLMAAGSFYYIRRRHTV